MRSAALLIVGLLTGLALAARPAPTVKAGETLGYTLTCANGEHPALTLDLQPGEVVVLYGPSGELLYECVAGE
jgi:hypothetical protein